MRWVFASRRRFFGEPLVCEHPDGFRLKCEPRAVRRVVLLSPTKKAVSEHKVQIRLFWWGKVDSNHRSKLQQIYSLSPLATREFPQTRGIILYSKRFVNRFLENILRKKEIFFHGEKAFAESVEKSRFQSLKKSKTACKARAYMLQ